MIFHFVKTEPGDEAVHKFRLEIDCCGAGDIKKDHQGLIVWCPPVF